MKHIEKILLNIPLGSKAHYYAKRFAVEQAIPKKRKRVYLNTLAVYAVHRYLKRLQVNTDFEKADSWHPGIQALFDVADLVIPGIGKLECRPVMQGETSFELPPEVTKNRVAYVVVQFSEQLDQAHLLGFVPAVNSKNPPLELQIKDITPMDKIFDYLERIEGGIVCIKSDDQVMDKISQKLGNCSMLEIVTQLERIYRTEENEDEWRYEGARTLAYYVANEKKFLEPVERESIDEDDEIELQDLTEELMEKLIDFWQN